MQYDRKLHSSQPVGILILKVYKAFTERKFN
jgi:hypothetical protein